MVVFVLAFALLLRRELVDQLLRVGELLGGGRRDSLGVRVGLALRRRSVGCLGRVGGVVLGEARGRGVVLDAVVDGVDVVRRALVTRQRALLSGLLS